MISAILTAVIPLFLLLFRFFGHVVRIRAVTLFPLSFHNVSYTAHRSSKKAISSSIDRISVILHFPLPWAPYWATIIADNVFYKDRECTVNLTQSTNVVWFLPVFFGHTTGAVITAKLDGFNVTVTNSKATPGWVNGMRQILVSALLEGETIRVHDMKTKVWISEPVVQMTPADRLYLTDGDDENDLEATAGESSGSSSDTSTDGDEGGGSKEGGSRPTIDQPTESLLPISKTPVSDETETRVRLSALQWQIYNHENERLYTFGHFDAELRRPWGSPPFSSVNSAKSTTAPSSPGSFVLMAKNARWTKCPNPGPSVYGTMASLWQLIKTLFSLPSFLVHTIYDPLTAIDLEVPSCQVTFCEFRLRDAELFIQAADAARKRYATITPEGKRVIGEWGWDLFIGGLLAAFPHDKDEKREEREALIV